MPRVVALLVLSLYFSQATADLPQASPESAGQVHAQTAHAQTTEAQKQAWKILGEGAHGNMDKRANAIQALGLDAGDPEAVRLAEAALGDKEPSVRGAAAKALGALGSSDSIPKLQNSLNDKDISVALAAGHALIQLKSNSGYEVYYSVVAGTRKGGGTSPITGELNQMKTPARAIAFAFDEGVGFLPYGGYGMEAYHAWKKRSTAPTRAAAARELAKDPDPRTGRALAKAVSDKDWSVRAAAVEAIAKRGDSVLLADVLPAMSDKKDIVRYSAAAAVLRLSRSGQEKGSLSH
ncbi:MAG: HEAT repeat domain-containing protein [Candidatus Sulfotelmatobacter sp.]